MSLQMNQKIKPRIRRRLVNKRYKQLRPLTVAYSVHLLSDANNNFATETVNIINKLIGGK